MKFTYVLFLLFSIKIFSSDLLNTLKNTQEIYNELKLNKELSFKTFERAINGLNKINSKNKNIITIIDFSIPSLIERGFVIDLIQNKVLYKTYIMHGKNSGDNITTSFSNKINSYQSSPGFYITENSYYGQFGYSLRLNGIEKGINDKAKERAIVIHGSDYGKPFKGATMLSKTLGCPAVPKELAVPIINLIKDGSILYIHTDKEEYLNKTKY